MEPEFPNILFAEDVNIYYINKRPYYVLGGAYSVDKFYRVAMGYKWFATEQIPTLIEKINGEIDGNSKQIQQLNKLENLTILTHTCPYKYMPTEAFLSFVDQSTVDNSMEELLNKLEANVRYEDWYCGHFHIEKRIDKIHFNFKEITEIDHD